MSIPRLLIVLAVTAAPLAAQRTLSQTFVPRDSRQQTMKLTPIPFPGGMFESQSSGVLTGHFEATHACLSPVICDSFGAQAATKDQGFRLFASEPPATGEAVPFIPSSVLAAEALAHAIALAENSAPCYAIRSYGFTAADPRTGLTRPNGVTTCQPGNRVRLKDVIVLPASR